MNDKKHFDYFTPQKTDKTKKIRFPSQISENEIIVLKSAIAIKSWWSLSRNKFLKREILRYNSILEKDQMVSLIKVVKILNYQSGVKQSSCLLTTILFLIFSILGFSSAYYCITSGYRILAGALFISTPLLVFFIIVGKGMVTGDQYQRFNDYLKDEKCEIHEILRKAGFRIANSISRSNRFFFHKFFY